MERAVLFLVAEGAPLLCCNHILTGFSRIARARLYNDAYVTEAVGLQCAVVYLFAEVTMFLISVLLSLHGLDLYILQLKCLKK